MEEDMIKTTLQNRLILLMVVSSIFFISIFAAIQLNNQMSYITRFNIYRSKLGSFVARSTLQKAFSTINEPGAGPAVDLFKAAITPLAESEVVEEAVLISKDGDIAGSLPHYA